MDRLENVELESLCLIFEDDVFECRISVVVVVMGDERAVVAVDLDRIIVEDLVKLIGEDGIDSSSLFFVKMRIQSCMISFVSACSTNEFCCLD